MLEKKGTENSSSTEAKKTNEKMKKNGRGAESKNKRPVIWREMGRETEKTKKHGEKNTGETRRNHVC